MKVLRLAPVLFAFGCKGDAPASSTTNDPGSNGAAAPTPQREWAVAQLTLKSGNKLVVNFRPVAPAGITRADFPSRVTVECTYPDLGNGAGYPSKEVLQQLQGLEQQLASPTAVRLMSKTGQGTREAVFQAKAPADLVALVDEKARALGLPCTTAVEADPTWSLWESAATQFIRQSR